MKSALDFVAIDVETANSDRGSICQIGVVVFLGGEIHETWQSLVDPEDKFDPRNISIHGIDESNVRNAPSFADVIPELVRRLTDQVVVSHTAFDREALDRAFQKHGLPTPHRAWLDTARVSQKAWPQFASRGFNLSNVAAHFGIKFRHHDALEDARVSGLILLRAISETGRSIREWLDEQGQPTSLHAPRIEEIGRTIQTAAQADGRSGRRLKFGDEIDAEAAARHREAAEKGDASAQRELGLSYADGWGVPADDAEAVVWFRKAAEQGDTSAQFHLGQHYDNGWGVPEDDVEAMAWYHKAAEQGDASAQFRLGQMYYDRHDEVQAEAWYRRAADQGAPWHQTQLGYMYLVGAWVAGFDSFDSEQDHKRGTELLHKAAEQGYWMAQSLLGGQYESGLWVVAQDYGEAIAWWRKAAEQGDASSQSRLGEMYEAGKGVPQDYVEAHKWLNLAASRVTGDEQKRYAEARDAVAMKMPPAQLAEAQGLAREWKVAFEKRRTN